MVEQEIAKKLKEIEQKHQVKVLLAVESGSRAWGFPSPDSDYDVRFIYRHDRDWYLQLFDRPDVIELAIHDDLDINGWDLNKALRLGASGNATLYEWLNSPVVYHMEPEVGKALVTGVNTGFNAKAAFYHYVSLAKKFSYYLAEPGDEVKLKRFFYLLRALLCAKWLKSYGSIPPVAYEKLLEELVLPQQPELYERIVELQQQKSHMDESEGMVLPVMIRAFVQSLYDELHRFEFATALNAGKMRQRDWNELFRQLLAPQ